MARESSQDFVKVVEFIENYGLKDSLKSEAYLDVVKSIHKKYLSVICFIAELQHQKAQPTIVGTDLKAQSLKYNSYLSEAISELGTVFFLILNGCYKASQQVLRSSIENFLKSLGSIEHSDITNLKNVYEVIDKSGDISFFKIDNYDKLHKNLKEKYGSLCKATHTATHEDMQTVSALGYFPVFNIKHAKECSKMYIAVTSSIADSSSKCNSQWWFGVTHLHPE